MIYRRTVERIEVSIMNGKGAGERCVAEGESSGPDSSGQVSQGIEGYSAVGGQLASGHRDHTAGPEAKQVIPRGVEQLFLTPRQDAQPRESGCDALTTQHLGAQELLGHLQEIGDVRGLCGHASGVTVVLLFGGAEEDPVLTGHGVEVLPAFQRDGDGRPPLLIRPKDDVDSFAQAGDGLAGDPTTVPWR
jgi:hypothetical protein